METIDLYFSEQEELEIVLSEYDRVLSEKLKLHIFRNDFKPEPLKRLRPEIWNLDEFIEQMLNLVT